MSLITRWAMARSLWIVALLFPSVALRAQEYHVPLNDSWRFCQVGKERWYPAEVPGVVQTDLLRNGLIPDFYKGSNIDSVQWIENEDWIYKRAIVANDTLLKNGHIDLVFNGLDTFAEVYLNDSLLGKADNMFRTWEWPIKEKLKRGANELKIIFRSPIKEGAKLRDAYGIQLPHDNDPSGVSPYIRKAAYQFGWDFCPRLVTSGIWQGVELRCWSRARTYGVDIRQVSNHGAGANVLFMPMLDIDEGSEPMVKVMLDDSVIIHAIDRGPARREDAPLVLASMDLSALTKWNPRGYGERSMHKLRCEVWQGRRTLSVWEDKVGFADHRLDQRSDTDGSNFSVHINGRSVFAKGANLVPPRMILTSTDDHTWCELVADMQRANMNMVRVWAGGVYPPESFLDACDTAGIMVWQDIMLANMAPHDQVFKEDLDQEIQDLILRSQRHPCVVLYCGNNELEVAWRNWGWQDRYGLHGRDSVLVAYGNQGISAVSIPTAIDVFGGADVPYTRTSPLSNWGNAEGLKSGDLHYWGVWHGDSAFSSFKNNVGRFVSEYGFQSYPDSALLSHYIDPKELYLGSPAMKRMQRSYKTDKPIWDAIKRELGKEPKTLGEFIEDSQEVQAKAYRMAIEAHMAAQPHCMGTLFWQLNDCWPGPSWSLIDFEGHWKPGMFEVQRLYADPTH